MGVAQRKTIYVLPHHREWLLPGVRTRAFCILGVSQHTILLLLL
jgi:hypothetical protein